MRPTIVTLCIVLTAAAPAAVAQTPAPASAAASAPADAPNDFDALSVADQATTTTRSPQNWQVFGEGDLSRGSTRGAASAVEGGRASIDLRYDGSISPGLRAVLSDRLDLEHSNADPHETNINTLREAYLSWQVRPDAIADVGRINLRYGAALGYNPTDFFKGGALRSIVSPDPVSLRENRQGTVVVQGQKLWDTGSVTAAFSPQLGSSTSASTFALDLGSTNPNSRWLVAASQKFSDAINPQILLFGGVNTSTQVGFNLSSLINSATVAYLEYSTGKGRTLVAQVLGLDEPEKWQRRAALGLTYTTAFNLSLTAEFEHNSAAPDRSQWNAFSAGAPNNALGLLGTAQSQQDLPTRQAAFVYASWRDAVVRSLDISAFVRWDAETRSRAQWAEARYHWSKTDIALQWQLYSGRPGSLFGSVPQARMIEVLLRMYL